MDTEKQSEFGAVRFEARVDLRDYVWSTMPRWVVGVTVASAYILVTDRAGFTPWPLAATITILMAVGVGAVVQRLVVFQVTDTHVVKRRPVRSPVVVPRSDITEAVVAETYPFTDSRQRAHLLDRTTSTLLTSLPLTDLADIHELAAAAPKVTSLDVLQLPDAQIRWPMLLPWGSRTRTRFVVVVLSGTLAILGACFALVWLVFGI